MFFGSEKSLFFIAGQIKNLLIPKRIFNQIGKLIFKGDSNPNDQNVL